MDLTPVVLRPSHAPDWMACSARMAYLAENPQKVKDGKEHRVSTVLGVEVHDMVSGRSSENRTWRKPGHRIAYDAITRNEAQLERQVKNVSGHVRRLAEEEGIEITAWEKAVEHDFRVGKVLVKVGGRVDAIGRKGKTSVVIDIKTGMRPPMPSFTQLGLYAMVMNQITDLPSPAAAGIIWAPRKRPSDGSIVWRETAPLVDHAKRVVREVARVAVEGGVARPCDRCYSCPVADCIFGQEE